MEPASKSPLHVRVSVITLTVLFGMGSWIAINGLWVQLPLLVALNIPEGYDLASYLTVIIQLANIGPLVFSISNYFMADGKRLEIPTIFLTVSIGSVSAFLLIFFWDSYTVWRIDGTLHSTALLTLAFFLAIVDCTSSVAFTPFMSLLVDSYLTWYFVGEGLSALVPSILALIQGVGSKECIANGTYVNLTTSQNCTEWIESNSPARFPPQDFFGFLFAMMLTCLGAFTMLNYLPLAKREHILLPMPSEVSESTNTCSRSPSYGMDNKPNSNLSIGKGEKITPLLEDPSDSNTVLTQGRLVYLFAVLCFVTSLSNGALPSIQSYSCGAYGLNTYLLASTLSNIANPLAATLVMLAPRTNLALVGATTALGTLAGSYCFLTAILSPAPPLQGEAIGNALIILAWIFTMGLFVYAKATIAWILRLQPNSRRLLIWYGGITQIGSMIGSFVMWPLINVAQVFIPYYGDICAGHQACETSEVTISTTG